MNQQSLHQIFGLGMLPLWLCSLALLALIFNHMRALRRGRIIDEGLTERMRDHLARLDVAAAEAEARKSDTVLGRAWSGALREFQAGGLALQEALSNASSVALKPLRANLNHIATIGVIAPMFGLIGTVVGMILTFATLAETGGMDKTKLAAGLAFALYKTAGGLIVAIPAIIAGRWFSGKIAAYAAETEASIQTMHYAHVHARAGVDSGESPATALARTTPAAFAARP